MALPTVAPSSLVLTVLDVDSIKLDWTAGKGQTQYWIYRSQDTGTTYAKIAWVEKAVTTYTDNTVVTAVTYYYKVLGHNADGNTAFCTPASATAASAVALAAPTITVKPWGGDKSEINITNASVGEEYHYLYRKAGSGSYAKIADIVTGTLYYLDSGLTAGTTYTYKCRDVYGVADNQCTLGFDSGSVVPVVGEFLTGETSGDTGRVVSVTVTSGAWADGDAAGSIVLDTPVGISEDGALFINNELIDGSTGGTNILTADGAGVVHTYSDYSSEVTVTPPKPFLYLAYGSGTTAEGAALTALTTEIARALVAPEIVSTYTANDTVRFAKEFTADGAISVNEVGILDASTTGTLLARKKLAATLSVADNQNFVVQYDIVIKDGGCGG